MPRPIAITTAPDIDFGRTVVVREYDRPPDADDDAVTAQSIGMMQDLSDRDASAPAVQAATRAAVRGLEPTASFRAIADAVFWWIKGTVTYRHENELNTPYTLPRTVLYDQTLIPPAALLAMPQPEGDCPHFSMLCASMLRNFGIPNAYKTIAASADSPDFSHVYVVAQIEPGLFYPLDTSNGPAPGVEYSTPTKSKVWPNHQDTSDEAMIRNSQRNYELIHRVSGRRPALGDDDGGDDSGTSWTDVFTTIADDTAKVITPLVNPAQKPVYVSGQNGAQVLWNPTTGQIINANANVTGATTTATAKIAGISTTTLLLGGIALLVLMSQKR